MRERQACIDAVSRPCHADLNVMAVNESIPGRLPADGLDMFYLLGDGNAEQVPGAWVTPGFVAGLGIAPAMGRGFDAVRVRRSGRQRRIDPLSLAATAVAYAAMRSLAIWWPARRAASVDPAATPLGR